MTGPEVRRHGIGPFRFLTTSDIPLPSLLDARMERCLVPPSPDSPERGADIRYSVSEIPDGSPEAPDAERRLGLALARCHSPARIRGGTQLLPLLLPPGTGTPPDLVDGMRLARSARILAQIESAVDGASDPAAVSVLAHSLTVEIRDFERLSATVFLAGGLRGVLSTPAAFYSLRKLFSLFLPSLGAFMVHSAGISLECGTVLLAAPDSGGKSTAAAMAPAGSVLGDDRMLVVMSGDGFAVHPTPWNESRGCPGGGRAAGVFVLDKSDSFGIGPVDPREAFAFLWQDNRTYFEDLPAPSRDSAFDSMLRLCRSVPCGRIGFPRDAFDWGAVEAFVRWAR